MAKGKSKTMTKAAMRQRKHAAQASAVARRKRKLIEKVFEACKRDTNQFAKIIGNNP